MLITYKLSAIIIQESHFFWFDYLNVAILTFFIGLSGLIFNYRNFLITMLSIELMYLGLIVAFLIVASVTYDPKGQVYALVLLILAASESSIGLGMLIVLYRFGNSIDFTEYQFLKG